MASSITRMTQQVSTIWNNLLHKAIWGKGRFGRVVESISSVRSMSNDTKECLESAENHNRSLEEWLSGVGFRPFQQLRAQHMEEHSKAVDGGAGVIQDKLSDIQTQSRELRVLLEKVQLALQSNSISSFDGDPSSSQLQEFSDALVALDRHIKSVDALQHSAEGLHIKTQELRQAVQQDQDTLNVLSSSIESVRDDL